MARPTAGTRVARRTKLVAIALLTLIGSAAGASAVLAATGSNAHNRGVILFAGDSNVLLAASPIVWRTTWLDHSDNGYVPVIASRVGATIRTEDCLDPNGCTTYDYWRTKLGETLTEVRPDAVVNDLGINDTVSAGTATTPGYGFYGWKIDWFMGLIPRDTPVFWTNLPCAIEPSNRATGCKGVNAALAAARSRWPNLVVVDWASRANAHPEYINRSGQPPFVHLSPAGTSAWVDLVIAAVDARIPKPAG